MTAVPYLTHKRGITAVASSQGQDPISRTRCSAKDMEVTSDNSELSRSFNSPDETRNFPKGKGEVVKLAGMTFMRGNFEPGWRWSECVKPIAGTESCQVTHTGVMISGRLGIRTDDGREVELGPGDIFAIPPGHDG